MEKNYFTSRYKKRWLIRLMKMSVFILISIVFITFGVRENSRKDNAKTVKTLEDFNRSKVSGETIKITADSFTDLKVTMEEDSGKEKTRTKGYYVAIKLSDKMVTVYLSEKDYNDLLKKGKGPFVFIGTTYKLQDDHLKFFKEYLLKNGIDADQIDSLLSTNYLDGQDTTSYFYFIIAFLPLLIMTIIYFGQIKSDIKAHNSLKKYSKGKLKAAIRRIDKELSYNEVFKQELICITQNYIIVYDKQVFFALPIKQLMWVYEEMKKIGKSPFMPKVNTLNFVFSDTKKYTVIVARNFVNPEEAISSTLNYISDNYPRTVVGYNDEAAMLFKKSPIRFAKLWKRSVIELENMNEV